MVLAVFCTLFTLLVYHLFFLPVAICVVACFVDCFKAWGDRVGENMGFDRYLPLDVHVRYIRRLSWRYAAVALTRTPQKKKKTCHGGVQVCLLTPQTACNFSPAGTQVLWERYDAMEPLEH
jgi:hypothetical protein